MSRLPLVLLLLTAAGISGGQHDRLEREDEAQNTAFANEVYSPRQHHQIHKRQNLDEGPSGPGTSAANDYVDDVLKNIPRLDAHINPARLGDLERGGFRLTNITLFGINDAYRHGNAHLNITRDFLHIVTRLGSPKLIFRGRYHYKLPWILPNVSGNVRFGLNRIVILFDLQMSPDGPELADLRVVDLHSITVDELTGLGPLNWALRYLFEVVIRKNRPKLINALEQQSRIFIEDALKKTPGAATAVNEIDREIVQAMTDPERIDTIEPS